MDVTRHLQPDRSGGVGNREMIGVIKTGEVYAIAMRNEDTDLHALINEGLAELMASEKWEELKLKYIVTE